MEINKIDTFIEGAYIINSNFKRDNRGYFINLYLESEFAALGLEATFKEAKQSFNHKAFTIRGMHYQLAPCEEVKLVRCEQGVIYDMILDIRPKSSTYRKHYGLVLASETPNLLYIPKGCAHGYITLVDNVTVSYFSSTKYSKECERGIRYNDPFFNIVWPATPKCISERDLNHPDYKE